MPESRSYDSKKVTVVIDGVHITGLAEGTFVNCSRDADSFESVAGGHGEISTSETNDPRGTITLTVKQTSAQLSFLNGLANSKKIVPAWVYSNNDPREKAGGNEARLKKPADKGFNKTVQNREFGIQVFDYQAS